MSTVKAFWGQQSFAKNGWKNSWHCGAAAVGAAVRVPFLCLPLLFVSFAALPLGFLGFSSAYGAASTTSSVKFGFVDMQAAILQTEEGKVAKAKIEKEAEAKRQDILNQEKEIKKLDDEFQAQQAVLSDDAKKSKQAEFQNKFQKLQAARMSFEQDVRQKEMQETQKIFKNLTLLIEEIAKKKGYDIVFERGSGAVLYAAKIDDLTTEVVASYNAKFKVSQK